MSSSGCGSVDVVAMLVEAGASAMEVDMVPATHSEHTVYGVCSTCS